MYLRTLYLRTYEANKGTYIRANEGTFITMIVYVRTNEGIRLLDRYLHYSKVPNEGTKVRFTVICFRLKKSSSSPR